MTNLAERLDQTPEPWRPAPSDSLIGKLLSVDFVDSKFGGGRYPVLEVETADGVTSVHAFHTVLKSQLRRVKPKVGDEIAIKYLGDHPNGYKDYRVVVDRSTSPDVDEVSDDVDEHDVDDAL